MYLNTSGMENAKVEIETVQKINKKLEGLKLVTEGRLTRDPEVRFSGRNATAILVFLLLIEK